MIGVDGGKSAELEAVDESENGGAAGGDVVVGKEDVEVAEGVVDALGGLEALVAGKKGGFEVEGVGFHQLSGMSEAKEFTGSFDGKLTAAARGGVVLAAGGIGNGVGYCGFGFHFFPFCLGGGYTPPPVFFCKSGKQRGYV